MHFHEDSTVEYPHYYTKYTVPGFGEKFTCIIDSQHCEYKCDGDGVMKDFPENATNLNDDELKERKIVHNDIKLHNFIIESEKTFVELQKFIYFSKLFYI